MGTEVEAFSEDAMRWAPGMPDVYLPEKPFDGPLNAGYRVEVTSEGVTVYSECCADTMSDDTARALYNALGRYLADQESRPVTSSG